MIDLRRTKEGQHDAGMGTADLFADFNGIPKDADKTDCILMATDPGDLVLDPTCGSGTTAYVAEQWGRRWITIDTSRVALALARARIMGARYPYYLLADSREGQLKEAEITRTAPSTSRPTATSATASSTSACRTSRSSPSPTTPRSTSSGSSGRRPWSPCASAERPRRGNLGGMGERAAEDPWPAGQLPLGGVADPPQDRGRTERTGRRSARSRTCRRLVGRPASPASGDRRLHRRQGRLRVPLRQALRGQEDRPRRRPLHRREPLAPPRAPSTRTTS
jgi:hypothetical protein